MRSVIAMLALVVMLLPSRANADLGSRGTVGQNGGLTATATVAWVQYSVGGGSGPQCSWERWSQGRLEDFWHKGARIKHKRPEPLDPDVEHTDEEIAAHDQATAAFEQFLQEERSRRSQPSRITMNHDGHPVALGVYTAHCPNSRPGIQFVDLSATANDLIPGAHAAATGQIPTPTPTISPPPEIGGWVNLGMWLATQHDHVQPVTAEAGPTAWITITPTHQGLTFDFGNGDTITCDGFGVPIEAVHPDLNTTEQSPTCGYTYRHSSPDNAPYQLTTGSTWALPYDSSDGPGQLDNYTSTTTNNYNVDELQTIGIQN